MTPTSRWRISTASGRNSAAFQKLKAKLERQRQHPLPPHPQQLRLAQVRVMARPSSCGSQDPLQAQPSEAPLPALRRSASRNTLAAA